MTSKPKRQRPVTSRLPTPQQLEFELESFKSCLDVADLPRQIRRLLQALATVGARDPFRVVRDDDEDRIDDFFGEWILQASKSELARAVRRCSKTIQRDLDWFDRSGSAFHGLLNIDRETKEAHLYQIWWPAVRETPRRASPEMSQGQKQNRKMSPGHVPGTNGAPHGLMGMDSESLEFPEGKSKSNPTNPSQPRLAFRDLLRDDLANIDVLQSIFPTAIAAGVAKESEQDWLGFVALGRYCQRSNFDNPAAAFTSILRGDAKSKFSRGPWNTRPADKDWEWARQAISGSPSVAPAAELQQAATRIGQPAATSQPVVTIKLGETIGLVKTMPPDEIRKLLDWLRENITRPDNLSRLRKLRDEVERDGWQPTEKTVRKLAEALAIRLREAIQ